MSRALVTLWRREDRERAHRWIDGVRTGRASSSKRRNARRDQNAKMWASSRTLRPQVQWHGPLSPDDWKIIFLDALKREVRMVPNIDGAL